MIDWDVESHHVIPIDTAMLGCAFPLVFEAQTLVERSQPVVRQ